MSEHEVQKDALYWLDAICVEGDPEDYPIGYPWFVPRHEFQNDNGGNLWLCQIEDDGMTIINENCIKSAVDDDWFDILPEKKRTPLAQNREETITFRRAILNYQAALNNGQLEGQIDGRWSQEEVNAELDRCEKFLASTDGRVDLL